MLFSLFSIFPSQSFLDRKEVAERVVAVLKNFEKVDAAKLNEKAHFSNDLGLDSLDAVEVRRGPVCFPSLLFFRGGFRSLFTFNFAVFLFFCVSCPLLQVCMALEEEFCITIPDAEAEKILSVEDAVNFVATHPQAR